MSDERQGRAEAATPPKINAEDNPWYLLATLYGVPVFQDFNLRKKNRIAWNRYFAAKLGHETRRRLTEETRYPVEELTPFLPEELQEFETVFAERCRASAKQVALSLSNSQIDFSNVQFDRFAAFDGYLFSNSANFVNAAFRAGAAFERASFCAGAIFVGVDFSQGIDFNRATFSEGAIFGHATFSGVTSFWDATFSGGVADFRGTRFRSGPLFHCTRFFSGVSFENVTFSDKTDFDKARFAGSCSFVNAKLKSETSFEGAIFENEPPRFLGATLHQGTVWRGITWPPKPKDKDEAGCFIDAYACLKLEMDRLKKHEDELNFFALEMQSRRVELGAWKGLPIALYGALSGYGRSYFRPLVALFYLALIGTLAFLTSDSLTAWQSLSLSWANTFNVFGFRKDFFDPKVIADLPGWLDVVAALQTILGTILIFLLGLGVRNKFRMK